MGVTKYINEELNALLFKSVHKFIRKTFRWRTFLENPKIFSWVYILYFFFRVLGNDHILFGKYIPQPSISLDIIPTGNCMLNKPLSKMFKKYVFHMCLWVFLIWWYFLIKVSLALDDNLGVLQVLTIWYRCIPPFRPYNLGVTY